MRITSRAGIATEPTAALSSAARMRLPTVRIQGVRPGLGIARVRASPSSGETVCMGSLEELGVEPSAEGLETIPPARTREVRQVGVDRKAGFVPQGLHKIPSGSRHER